MSSLYPQLLHHLQQDQPTAFATVISVKGSVPREVGAQMLIHPLGQHAGTVGGGCGEADVIRAGLNVMQEGQPVHVRVDLTQPISLESTAVCGGIMDVYVEAWGRAEQREAELALLQRIVAAAEAGEPLAVCRVVRAGDEGWLGRRWALGPGEVMPEGPGAAGELAQAVGEALAKGRHRLLRLPDGETEIFIEVLQRPPQLIIVGAGHIAVPLCRLGAMCDFSVTVIDDRAQYANRQRFPDARQVIAADIQQSVQALRTDANTYVVLVTRGHTLDVPCLLALVDRPLAYIGMIGSKRRVRAVFELLQSEYGIAAERLQRVHAPIGLPIAAETPAEIAVSIMAEIIQVRRAGEAERRSS